MIKDELNKFSEFVGGKLDQLAKDVESLKKVAKKSSVSDAVDKASLRDAGVSSFRFGKDLAQSETDVLDAETVAGVQDKDVTANGMRLKPSPYMNTAFTTFKESATNGLYRPLSVTLVKDDNPPQAEKDVLNLVESSNLNNLKNTIPGASSVAVMTAGSVGFNVRSCDYVLRVRTVEDTEDYKEKQAAVWAFPANGSDSWKNEAGMASFSDGVLTFGKYISAAIVMVSFEDGRRAVYKIAANLNASKTDTFKARTVKLEVEAVAGGTSQEELDGITRHEWGEDVVYPPVPELEKFYKPEDAHLEVVQTQANSDDEIRIVGGSVLLPEDVTESEASETVRAMTRPRTDLRIKRPVITLPKGKEYRFKIKNLKMPCLLGNVSTASDGTVTVSANATEKDSVFGDAVHIVIV